MHRALASGMWVALALVVLVGGQRDHLAGYDPTLELPVREMFGLRTDFELGAGTPLRTEAEVLDAIFPGNRIWRRQNTFRVVYGRVHDHWPKQPGVMRMVDPYLGPNGEAPIFWLVVVRTWRPGQCVFSMPDGEHSAPLSAPLEAPMEHAALVPDATGQVAWSMTRCVPNKRP